MTAIPKGFTGGLARLPGTEKEIKKALQRAFARLCIGQVRPFPDVGIARGLASARAVPTSMRRLTMMAIGCRVDGSKELLRKPVHAASIRSCVTSDICNT